MAGWSAAAEALSLDAAAVVRKLKSVGFFLDLDIRANGGLGATELQFLFNRILSLFKTEIHLWSETRQLPAMLGDGRSIDLFKLYVAVRGKGGYDAVSASRSWASVAEEIGLDSATGPSLKLMYVKYLDALERWLRIVLEEANAVGPVGAEKNSGLSAGEANKEANGPSHGSPDHLKKDGECTPPSGSKREQFLTPVRRNGRKLELDDAVVLRRGTTNGDPSRDTSLKRKREDLVGMLNWVKRIAQNSKDPSLGKLFSNGEKYPAYGIGKLFCRAILAREAMFIKRIPRLKTDEQLVQNVKEKYPCAYADSPGTRNQSNGKTRNNGRSESTNKKTDSGCLERCTLDNDMNEGLMADREGNHGKQRLFTDKLHIRTPLGPFFQAEVPEWTGKPSNTSFDSDNLKWLGTRIWPPENQVKKLPSEYPIGKGREETCECKLPGSVECVRFHVAEKRFQLMRELGSAFNNWKFNLMGEEVALSWTGKEQRAFKSIVCRNQPIQQKNFWDKLCLHFSQKGRKDLVSYYFNVFLLGRRCYQNRVTPNRIDSDDDETEYSFLSSPYGYVAVSTSKNMLCVQNAQCMDLDEYVHGG